VSLMPEARRDRRALCGGKFRASNRGSVVGQPPLKNINQVSLLPQRGEGERTKVPRTGMGPLVDEKK